MHTPNWAMVRAQARLQVISFFHLPHALASKFHAECMAITALHAFHSRTMYRYIYVYMCVCAVVFDLNINMYMHMCVYATRFGEHTCMHLKSYASKVFLETLPRRFLWVWIMSLNSYWFGSCMGLHMDLPVLQKPTIATWRLGNDGIPLGQANHHLLPKSGWSLSWRVWFWFSQKSWKYNYDSQACKK